MELLNPCYEFVICLRQAIESNQSVGSAVRGLIGGRQSDFNDRLRQWWLARERGTALEPRSLFLPGLQVALVETLERGLHGEPVLPTLKELEEEMRLAMADTVECHLQRLPVLLVLPLAGLVFPAFMLLVLGPLVSELLKGMQ